MAWLGSGSEERSSHARGGFLMEPLESRMLLAVSFEFDYSLDTAGFFDDESRRDLLEATGEMLSSFLDDDLLGIQEGGSNSWTATITHPATGEVGFGIDGLVVPQDTLIVYAGARDLGSVLGRGGAGGWSANGDQSWFDLIRGRGEPGAIGPANMRTDFAPWGGAITFNTETNWYFGASSDDLGGSQSDFVTVALHELTHLLGFSSGTDSFANMTVGASFVGTAATSEYDHGGFPQLEGGSHWVEGTTDAGLEALMDPSVTVGERKILTRLDLAALDDLGWDIDLGSAPGAGMSEVMLSALTGDGTLDGSIDMAGETDTYTFTSIAGGRAFAQVVLEEGTPIDVGIRVYDPAGILIATDDLGHVGASADVEFSIASSGDTYTIEVTALSGSKGDYTLRLDTEPMVHQKYYPEGFANNAISEFVSITNPNDFDVTFTITLRYEDPNLPVEESVVVMDRVVGAGLRNGETISDKGYLAPDLLNGGTIIKNTPYAIIVSSDGPLAVSLSHFDFSIATGESFTDVTSAQWSFPRGERAPGDVNDFVVFYNPNDHIATVTLTALAPGGPVQLLQNVQPMRRSGWGFNFENSLPEGVYGFVVSSQAFDPDDQDDHLGIVAALTHFDTVTGKGWGALGDPTNGSTTGVLPSLLRTADGDVELAFMNLGGTSAVVQIIGEYEADLPAFAENLSVAPGGVVYRTGEQLGLILGQRASISYTTEIGLFRPPIFVQAQETGFGDGTATGASTVAGREFVFGDAFINANKAGENYFETLSFYNPSGADIQVTVEIYFNDGVLETLTQDVEAGSFSHLNLHEADEILNHAKLNFFGIRLIADSPFAVTLEHFDLFFGSGWKASAAPIGFTTALSDIV